MKITKNRLQRIIKEEMSKALKENEMADGADADPGAPQEKDVDKVLTYIAKIDKKAEYYQLVDAILAHAVNVNGGIYKLVALKTEMPQIIKKAKSQ